MSAGDTYQARVATDPTTWLDRYGDTLYRYAILRVRSREQAEDLVQETLLAGLEARERFSGKSSEQTWLISILRRKIVDQFRKEARLQQIEAEVSALSEFFSNDGHWKVALAKWSSDPAHSVEAREFWAAFEACRAELPAILADAFVLRELEDRQRDEVCEILDITLSNLSVRLHRARLLLRRCLEHSWFSSNA
ncbi:MAG: sigma-70 family RNA polymerase sigma factor [Pirellulales bacterium]|nr:sigma-70 family RNA polymerase sigma factor [Pirellulales bacterium]